MTDGLCLRLRECLALELIDEARKYYRVISRYDLFTGAGGLSRNHLSKVNKDAIGGKNRSKSNN